ncbi:MAG: ABC transporter substrate-binding protein [Alphaproteobacteria bacterium]|nr:ABC transporter substrate-binding protein [Alphaproteobacteria bacterium]
MRRILLSTIAALAIATPAGAAELRVGLGSAITAIDPHFHVIGSNSALARNIYDGLINQGDRQELQPGLALSWRAVDATTWEFTLRPGARFHDGKPVTAEDVAASFRRIPNVRNSPSSFLPFVRPVVAVEAVSPTVVRMRTNGPFPLLPASVSRIAIIPAAQEQAETAAFAREGGAIGTGPFRFVSYAPGDRVVLARNDGWWGGAVPWERVTMRFVTADAARVAAALAGDLDLIEAVPPADQAVLARNQRIRIASAPSNRIMYLHLDSAREQSPHVKGRDGQPVPNALRDARVRRALSLSIDRQALVARIMDGQGEPSGQLVPEGFFGHVPSLRAPAADLARAQALLAEAGVAGNLTLTFHASNDRYPNDEKVAQAIAQMFTRAGVPTQLETLPAAVYFTRASRLEFSLIMGGAAAETGEASSVLRPLLATFNPQRGDGSGNRGRWSNARFDALLQEALATVDDARREALLRETTELAMGDVGVIPLFFLNYSWASGTAANYVPRADGYTLAINARPAR